MSDISLTIPVNISALKAASKMLAEIAKGLEPMNFGDELNVDSTGDHELTCGSEFPSKEPLQPLPLGNVAETAPGPSTTVQSPVVPPIIAPVVAPVVNIDLAAPGTDQTVVATVDNGTITDVEELDAAGQPWDKRIHPKSKLKVAKTGLWKRIKQLDTKSPGLVEAVEAEHRARLNQPLEFEIGNDGEAAPVVAPVVTPPPNAAAVFANVTPPPPVVVPVVTLPPAAVAPITFAEMIQTITPRTTAKPEFSITVNAVLAEYGLKALPELIGRDDIIPAFAARLDELWQG